MPRYKRGIFLSGTEARVSCRIMMQLIKTPFGAVRAKIKNDRLQKISLLSHTEEAENAVTTLAGKAFAVALRDYCENPRATWTLQTQEEGTDFQKRVWAAIRGIPFGETRTYQDLANQLDSSPRAVGTACKKNPLPLITPCHRVVSKSGLGGFSGQTEGAMLKVKEWLLAHEAKFKVNLNKCP